MAGRRTSSIKWQADGTSDKLTKACGLVYYAASGPGIIFRWFMENDREALENSGSVLWAKDWVRYCMTGELMTDETDPSMGLVDPSSRRYSQRVMELTGTGAYASLFGEELLETLAVEPHLA